MGVYKILWGAHPKVYAYDRLPPMTPLWLHTATVQSLDFASVEPISWNSFS